VIDTTRTGAGSAGSSSGIAEILTAGRDFAAGIDLLLSKYPQYRGMGLSRDRGTMIKVRPGKVLQWRYAG
jgi:hypothetical protein